VSYPFSSPQRSLGKADRETSFRNFSIGFLYMPLLSGPAFGRYSSCFNAQPSFNLADVKVLRIVCVVVLAMSCFAGIPLAAQTAHAGGTLSIGSGYNTGSVAVDGSGNVFVGDKSGVKEIVAVGGVVSSSSTVNTIGSGFRFPAGVAVDGSGNVFVVDEGHSEVKEIVAVRGVVSFSSTVNTIGIGFIDPTGVAVDGSGNLFVADAGSVTVSENVAVDGVLTSTVNTIGSGFIGPAGVAVDGSGNVFVADPNNNAVNEIVAVGGVVSSSSIVKTIGSGFSEPSGVAVDGSGNVFVADTGNNAVKEIVAVGGLVSSSSTVIVIGSGFSGPAGVAVDTSGNVFVADTGNGAVKEIVLAPQKLPTTAVGSTSASLSILFTFDSTGSIGAPIVLMQGATGLDFADAGTGSCTTNGTSYVYNTGDTCTVDVTFTPKYPGQRLGAVQLVTTGGTVVIATAHIYGTGTGPLVTFPGNTTVKIIGRDGQPTGVAVDGSGNVFVTDFIDKWVKEIVAVGGAVNTIGSGFSSPEGVAVDGSGNVFVADFENNAVKEIVAVGGAVNTIGSGFSSPGGVAVDGSGNVFVTDYGDSAVKEIVAVGGVVSSSSIVNTIGNGFSGPTGVAVDGSGNVFVADAGHNAVKEIVAVGGVVSSSSIVNTIGSGFSNPQGVTVDGSGNVFVADNGNSAVKEIMAVGGVVSSSSAVNTIGSGFIPTGVAVDGSGNIFVADNGNNAVKEIDLSDPPSLSFPTATNVGSTDSTDSVRTVTVANSGNAVLKFPIPASGNSPSISADFTLDSTSSGTCPLTGSTSSTPGTLAAGATCTLPISFTPAVGGTISGSLVLTDTNLNASPSTTQTISLNGTGQLITPTLAFATIPNHTYGDTPFIVTATSLSSGAVTYNVFSGPATISGGTITIMGTGTVMLQASQAAAGNYAAATTTISFTVNAATPTLAFAPIPAHTYGDTPFTVAATSASSGAVTYNVTGPATISGGTITIMGAGTVMLQASQAAAGNYGAATTTTSFTVNAATPTLAFAPIPAHTYGDTPFTVAATSASSGAVTYAVTSGPATISISTLTITGTGTVTLSASQAAAGNYAAATATTSFNVTPAVQTISFTVTSHTYGDTPFAVSATSNSTGAFTYTVVSGPATISGSTVTITGAGLVTLQGSEAADSNYAAGTLKATFLAAQAPLTVAANNATRAYGAINPAFTGSISGVKYSDTFTESFSTAATTATRVGSYAIVPSVSGSSLGNYAVSVTNGTLNITQAGTTTELTSSSTSAAAYETITLTAKVASTTSGTPTGTVTILDNGTAVETVALSNGTALYTTTLAPGVTHTLTASYTGDKNFIASASAATGTSVTVSPQDFTFSGTGSSATQTVMPGQAASFTYNLAPVSGSSYPGAVSLTVSGCPTGSTCTLSPTSFAANAGAQTVTLVVQTTAATARNREDNTPWSLALLLLPLAGARRLRRSSQRLRKLMLTAVFLFAGAALAGLSGCGGNSAPQQQPQNYSITVTAASGVMIHTSTVALNVQ
jgi:DNA-binding beta-propeller fold protein YncE